MLEFMNEIEEKNNNSEDARMSFRLKVLMTSSENPCKTAETKELIVSEDLKLNFFT